MVTTSNSFSIMPTRPCISRKRDEFRGLAGTAPLSFHAANRFDHAAGRPAWLAAGIDAIYSLRITPARRVTAYRDGEYMRLLSVALDHDATYGKK
ncbi:MAG: hypothetical protein EPN46_07800 [Candidimonas sp.]|nr:MAG: hypothetical protein EPN77_11735 [Candidimonas sp.]TAM24142.1 MAG: hypothetical protein EPN62_07875 [Candidimonas sp.]TAM76872.1 MAG: hypothetical protein EPN46_07800 [Candidimonas sp.]